MSWNLYLLKEKFDSSTVRPDYHPPTLGKRSDLISKLKHILPNLNFENESWGILEENGYSIGFDMGNKEYVDTIRLEIRGSGKPIKIIQTIMADLKWECYDFSSGKFMELGNLRDDNWLNFQNYREKTINKKD